MRPSAQSVVALGGGHGLYATLSSLRRLLDDLTIDELAAVVTVGDNGGSSGRLRQEFGGLPPGDLRMALAALCGDDDWGQTWARVLQHRFEGDGEGQLRGHAIGNLLIVGLWELMGDHVRGLDWVGKLLGAKGRVLPMANTSLDITANVRGLDPQDPSGTTQVRGQVQVAKTGGTIESVQLHPQHPPACPEALVAVYEADWVLLGPGSWYTSVIPHLLVPQLREALETTQGNLVVVLNLEPQAGETPDFGPEDHLRTLLEHAPGLQIHTVLADARSVADAGSLAAAVAAVGARLVVADIGVPGEPKHDPDLLAQALRAIFEAAHR